MEENPNSTCEMVDLELFQQQSEVRLRIYSMSFQKLQIAKKANSVLKPIKETVENKREGTAELPYELRGFPHLLLPVLSFGTYLCPQKV